MAKKSAENGCVNLALIVLSSLELRCPCRNLYGPCKARATNGVGVHLGLVCLFEKQFFLATEANYDYKKFFTKFSQNFAFGKTLLV